MARCTFAVTCAVCKDGPQAFHRAWWQDTIGPQRAAPPLPPGPPPPPAPPPWGAPAAAPRGPPPPPAPPPLPVAAAAPAQAPQLQVDDELLDRLVDRLVPRVVAAIKRDADFVDVDTVRDVVTEIGAEWWREQLKDLEKDRCEKEAGRDAGTGKEKKGKGNGERGEGKDAGTGKDDGYESVTEV